MRVNPAYRDSLRKSRKIDVGVGMNNVLDNILGRMEEAQKNNRRLLLVIDGKCGSGKTTLSERLCERYGCSVFHIDDFYLPIIMQTPRL